MRNKPKYNHHNNYHDKLLINMNFKLDFFILVIVNIKQLINDFMMHIKPSDDF